MASSHQCPVEDRIRMVIMVAKHGSVRSARLHWTDDDEASPAPNHQTISRTYDIFVSTGSVLDLPRTGRPVSVLTAEKKEEIERSVEQSPKLSLHDRSLEMSIPRSTLSRSITSMRYQAYRCQTTVMLTGSDPEIRKKDCQGLLNLMDDDPFLEHLI